MNKRMNLFSLAWPLFVENVLFMLLGFIDVFVLSRYHDAAASSVSAANQIINICNIVFSIISGATAILISQSLGAQKRKDASMIAALSLMFSTALGLGISLIIAVFHREMLTALGAQGEILEYACEYLLIVGGCIFTQTILNSLTAIIRSHGHTKISMYVTTIMNVVNTILDIIFVLGLGSIPAMGVKGAAIATTIARVVGIIILGYVVFKNIESPAIFRLLKPFPKREAKTILSIGLPSAFESINYNLSQLVVTSVIFHFLTGTDYIAKTYFSNLIVFSYIFSGAFGQAAQILVGYHIGDNDPDAADKVCMYSLKVSLILSMIMAGLAWLFREPLMNIFTSDPTIVAIGASLFFIDIFVEFGRAFNTVVISGLRGAGDTVYPSVVCIIPVWVIATFGAYFFAVPMGLGIRGVWIAFAIDECVRGMLMLLRWKSGRWKTKSVYTRAS